MTFFSSQFININRQCRKQINETIKCTTKNETNVPRLSRRSFNDFFFSLALIDILSIIGDNLLSSAEGLEVPSTDSPT